MEKQYQEKWLQHVQRKDTNRLPKQALQYKPKGRRNVGRPRKRWRDQLRLEDQGTGNTPKPSWTWWWCFEHYMLIVRRLNCIDAASGIVTLSKWLSGAQVARTAFSLLCPSWSCLQAVRKTCMIYIYIYIYIYIPLLYIQWKTPVNDQRNCPKHVEFPPK